MASQQNTALGGPQLTFTGPSDTSTLNNMAYSAAIQDEAGKLNINTAPLATLEVFFTSDVAANIVAWRTASTSTSTSASSRTSASTSASTAARRGRRIIITAH